MSPEASGALFGTGAGILAGGLASAAGASTSQAVAIGLATGAVGGVTAYVIAKHKATERQRQYAEERARFAYQNAPPSRKDQYRKTRYIAVDTVREQNSSGANSVMIYDVKTQRIAANTVYDLKQSPKEGTVSKFDAISSNYVGGGTPVVTPTSGPVEHVLPTQSTLPIFFPPQATVTTELPIEHSGEKMSLGQLSDGISKAMEEAGYERKSYYWLDKEHAPGFAIITHIEQIHPDGTPVSAGRWSFDLPRYDYTRFSIATFLAAMIKADPGN